MKTIETKIPRKLKKTLKRIAYNRLAFPEVWKIQDIQKIKVERNSRYLKHHFSFGNFRNYTIVSMHLG